MFFQTQQVPEVGFVKILVYQVFPVYESGGGKDNGGILMPGFYYLCGVFGVIFYSFLAPISRKFALGGFPPFAFMATSMFFLCLYASIATFVFEQNFSLSSVSRSAWLQLAVFAFLNFIGFFLYVKAIAGIPAVHYQILGMLTPVFGGAFAWFLLKESVDWRMFAGFLIMCLGLFVALSGKLFPPA